MADDPVVSEPVSPCYSLFSPVTFGKTGNLPFSWNDLRSIFFQVLSTFPSVMVVSLRCKTCDHFFRISGTLDLVTGGKFQTTVSSPLRSANPALVTVEHIHVNAGGQAMVSVVGGPGGGDRAKSEEQPHAKQMQCT